MEDDGSGGDGGDGDGGDGGYTLVLIVAGRVDPI